MRKKIILFTDNFPFGNSETFLETELLFLEREFELTLVPLFPREKLRSIPQNVKTAQPLLTFSPKDKFKLILNGIFNLSPLFFAVPEFFNHKVFLSKQKLWNFFTSLLLVRSMWKNLELNFAEDSILYFYWADKTALLAPFIKKKINCKVVVRFHGSDIYETAKGGYIPFRKFLFESIDLACPISKNGKDYLIKEYPQFAPKEIIISRLGVRYHGSNPINSQNVFQLISCSNLVPLKRVEMIAQALKFIDFDVKWTHVGGGRRLENLQNEIKKLPANIHVELKGVLPNSDVMALYANHPFDLFLNVSESEGIPVSIMEVLSFGIPVLATNVGGVSEIVDSHVGKLLHKNINPEELAEEIKHYYHSADKERYRTNAYKKWESTYNADENYKQFVAILRNL